MDVKSKSGLSRNVYHLLFSLIFIVGLFSSVKGVDFGVHPDEHHLINSIVDSFEKGTYLPARYHYSSASYLLGLIGALPEIISLVYSNPQTDTRDIEAAAAAYCRTHDFRIRLRKLFAVITYLTLLWLYCLVYFWRKSWREALLAAALVGLSWEVGYHSRWIAPDAIVMQFGAFTMMCLVLARKREKKRFWLKMSAVGAGLACGTKYTGGVFLFPVILAAYFYSAGQEKSAGLIWPEIKRVLFIFVVVYLITTPGTILEPVRFLADVKTEIKHYQRGHPLYTVPSGMKHFRVILGYYREAAFSRYQVISLMFFGLALMGMYLIFKKEESRMALIFLSVPLFHLGYMSCQRVMFARNHLMVIPFWAVFAARGWEFFYKRFSNFKSFFPIVTVTFLLINASWLIKSADSIARRRKTDYSARLSEYISSHPDDTFLLSPKVSRQFSFKKEIPANIKPSDQARFYVTYSNERIFRPKPSYLLNSVREYFGPDDVNLSYYPSWKASRRIIILPLEKVINFIK